MKHRSIALIGFRATGKTTVGKILAQKLYRTFIDMDMCLISKAGRDIAAWVGQEGWDSFRRAESALLEVICLQKRLVVATGGGIILDPQNREALRKNFFTAWLKADPHTIHRRLSSDPRSPQMRPALCELPILEEIEKVLSEREPLYTLVADIEIDTEGKEAIRIAEEILGALSSEP
ncbi:MAG TPA: shikimate kinase [Syntrophobacteraceae bacterium]|nr:shikimate kinase [Syntrophobacteraceae bacterium]